MINIQVNIEQKKRKLPSRAKMKSWLSTALTPFLKNAEIHVDFVKTSTMQVLNLKYRKKNYPTNVLSFSESLPLPKGKFFLGNIIVCDEVIAQEALAQHKKFQDHLAHLLIHGCLHFLGYDHEKEKDAEKMEALEIRLLKKLGIANPYE
jgi:probable rRNA maturation factor